MVIGFDLPRLENAINDSSSLDLQSFCQLQSQQLTSQSPIFFARIVYYNLLRNAHDEVINYAQLQEPFSRKTLAYLRSEEWLTDYPPAFTFTEVKLKDFQAISYICPIGYKNQKPEYVQIIAHQHLEYNVLVLDP